MFDAAAAHPLSAAFHRKSRTAGGCKARRQRPRKDPPVASRYKSHPSPTQTPLIIIIDIVSTDSVTAIMTRSHKFTDRDHSGVAEGTEGEHLPRFFAKSGPPDADPTKTKKNGGGKGNWGREGDEVEDYNYNMANPRRHSNSGSHGHHIRDFKTKFETVEPEPVFEEELHGASALETGEALENVSTSSTDASVNEDDHPKKA